MLGLKSEYGLEQKVLKSLYFFSQCVFSTHLLMIACVCDFVGEKKKTSYQFVESWKKRKGIFQIIFLRPIHIRHFFHLYAISYRYCSKDKF